MLRIAWTFLSLHPSWLLFFTSALSLTGIFAQNGKTLSTAVREATRTLTLRLRTQLRTDRQNAPKARTASPSSPDLRATRSLASEVLDGGQSKTRRTPQIASCNVGVREARAARAKEPRLHRSVLGKVGGWHNGVGHNLSPWTDGLFILDEISMCLCICSTSLQAPQGGQHITVGLFLPHLHACTRIYYHLSRSYLFTGFQPGIQCETST